MKVIDLIVKIANREEVPKKIKYRNVIWTYDEKNQDYAKNYENNDNLLCSLFCSCRTLSFINDEVELIEDKPEKIKEYKKNINLASSTNEERAVKIFKYLCDAFEKINELTKVVNYLLEKSDK